jgi:hypothetical protein
MAFYRSIVCENIYVVCNGPYNVVNFSEIDLEDRIPTSDVRASLRFL